MKVIGGVCLARWLHPMPLAGSVRRCREMQQLSSRRSHLWARSGLLSFTHDAITLQYLGSEANTTLLFSMLRHCWTHCTSSSAATS